MRLSLATANAIAVISSCSCEAAAGGAGGASAAAVARAGIAADPDMATVAQRLLADREWVPAAALPVAAAQAQALAAQLNATCYWPNIDYYSSQDRANWPAAAHLSNVRLMAQALATPGSPVFDELALAASTHCALGVWLARKFSNQNWWYGWIGDNLQLQGVYLLLGANRTSAAEQAAMVSASYDSAWWLNQWGGGANLVDMLTVQVLRGCASGNASALDQAFATMWSNAVQGHAAGENWQGIVDDLAYHFHGQQLLSAAYGQGWLNEMLSFWAYTAGTRFAMPDAHEAVLAQFMAEGDLSLTFGSGFDFGTQGRAIARPFGFSWSLPSTTIAALATRPGAAPWAARLAYFARAIAGEPQPSPRRCASP